MCSAKKWEREYECWVVVAMLVQREKEDELRSNFGASGKFKASWLDSLIPFPFPFTCFPSIPFPRKSSESHVRLQRISVLKKKAAVKLHPRSEEPIFQTSSSRNWVEFTASKDGNGEKGKNWKRGREGRNIQYSEKQEKEELGLCYPTLAMIRDRNLYVISPKHREGRGRSVHLCCEHPKRRMEGRWTWKRWWCKGIIIFWFDCLFNFWFPTR